MRVFTVPFVLRFVAGRILMVAFAAVIGCAAEAPPSDLASSVCGVGYLGDPAAPMVLELYYLGVDLLPHELPPCGAIDIVEPPQGGRVLFVGVRATNLDPCHASLGGQIRDPSDGTILGSQMRSTEFQPIAGRSGWGITSRGAGEMNDFSYTSHIAVCPNRSESGHDIQQQPALLEIEVIDMSGKRGRVSQRVIPRCAEPGTTKHALCECLCQADYSAAKCRDVTTFPDSPDGGSCLGPVGDGGP